MAGMQNMAQVRRAITDIWNTGDLAVADVLFTTDYVNHDGLIPDVVRGPEAIKFSVALYRVAFPDLRISVEELTADDDMVWLRWIAHSAPQEPTRSRRDTASSLGGSMRIRLVAGQIVESWTDWDQPDVLGRLGLLRPSGAPSAGPRDRPGQ